MQLARRHGCHAHIAIAAHHHRQSGRSGLIARVLQRGLHADPRIGANATAEFWQLHQARMIQPIGADDELRARCQQVVIRVG
jgi:MOSC domain-containing protein YiiM